MTRRSRVREARRKARSEAGFSLVEILVVMCLLTVAICTAALVAVKGLVQARHARVQADARTAISVLVNAEPPAGEGGSVAPDAPVDGWTDVLVVNASTGHFEPLEGEVPEGSVPIRRQWKLVRTDGVRVYTVSAEILASDAATPLPLPQGGGTFVFNRVVR